MTPDESVILGLKAAVDYATGSNSNARVRRVIPSKVDVKKIRHKLDMTQQQFAIHYGFPIGNVKNWEQGRRQPEGAARVLLLVIESEPKVVENVIRNYRQSVAATGSTPYPV